MTIDLSFFGYGAGLVMVGWLCGMIFAVVLSVIRKAQGVI